MPHKTPEARAAYQRAYRERNRDRLIEYGREYHRSGGTYSKFTFPTTIECAWCANSFVVSERPAKRGPLPRHCSEDCRREYINARYRSNYMQHTYGMSREEYEQMLASQDGRCACCGEEFPPHLDHRKGHNPVHIDHCHETGRVRGLLCSACNIAEGKFRKRGEMVMRYIARCDFDLLDWCAR